MAGKVSSDPNVFLLPDIGEGLQEAEVIKWLVKPGDTVEENQALAEVQTDKALTEIPSPRNGVIAQLHGQDGDVMKVHEPFVTYEGNASSQTQPPAASKSPQPSSDTSAASKGETSDNGSREDAGTVVGQMADGLAGVSREAGKSLATPAVRRLARDLGIDINTVVGTGIGGRVMERDVRSAQTGSSAKPPIVSTTEVRAAPSVAAPPRAPSQRIEMPQGADSHRVPIRDVRRIIAQRLRQSVDTAVHFTVMDEADVTELDALRKRLASASGEKVSFLPFVCSAITRALTGNFSALNATIDDAQQEIVQHRSVHLGIAADTENGLMVPVLRDADRLGVLELSRHIAHVASAARERTATREDLSGSTFTVSNVGSYAGRFATPIINYPEVAILAIGRTREGMVTKGGWFRVGKLMPLSLACDHRVVDGATGALALAEIVRLLQNPEQLMSPAR